MRTLKLLSAFIFSSIFFTSCITEVIVEDDVYIDEYTPIGNDASISLDRMLNSFEIWYVDIERTSGYGEVPLLQKAFTVSFKNGTFFANNNLVGMGTNGNGFGLDVGFYDVYNTGFTVDHDLDGRYNFRVTQLNANEIRLHNTDTNTSYYLVGYDRNTFDYDKVFYDNIHYFLHEYAVWEKVYTSEYGVLNDFDNENFVSFLYHGSGDNFQSSQDPNGTNINDLYFDYTGYYAIHDIHNNFYRKTLTLDYDYLGNENFELSVINDRRIELFHPTSGTVYEFVGKGYIQFKNSADGKKMQNDKKRKKKTEFVKHK